MLRRTTAHAAIACASVGVGLMTAACDDDKGEGVVALTLLHHQNTSFISADEKAIAAFEEAHPNVKISTRSRTFPDLGEDLKTLLPAGDIGADIISMPPAETCSYADYLAALPANLMTKSEADALFFAAPLENGYCDDTLIGLPIEYNMEYGGVVVNMDLYGGAVTPNWASIDDMFSDLGTRALEPPADYCESSDDPRACLRGTSGLSFLQADPLRNVLTAGILQRGGSIWDGDRLDFSSQEAVDAIRWIWEKAWEAKDHAAVQCANSLDDVDPVLNTVNEREVARYVGTWIVPVAKSSAADLDLEYAVHPPLFGSTHRFVTNGGWTYAVPKSSKHPQEAWEFIKYLTTDPDRALAWSKETGTIPALSANLDDAELLENSPGLEALAPILDNGHWLGLLPDVRRVFYEIIPANLYPLFCKDPTGSDSDYDTVEERSAAAQRAASNVQEDLDALGWW